MDETLSLDMRKAIRYYKPINTEGLTLYPIRLKEFEEFVSAKQSIEVLLRSLPVALMSKPLLQAFYTMQIDPTYKEESEKRLLYKSVLLLALSLRYKEEYPMEERLKSVQMMWNPDDHTKLQAIRFPDDSGIDWVEVTPLIFQRIRKIIAAQNGIVLYSDFTNPELIEAEWDVANMKSQKMDFNIDAIQSICATFSGCNEEEMEEWPIKKLLDRKDAIQRFASYIVCGIAESSGCSWKSGNPYPSPIFSKTNDNLGGTQNIADIANGAAEKAINSQEQ